MVDRVFLEYYDNMKDVIMYVFIPAVATACG
jgi:hypothetical protein